jgi:hypothetical protein
MNITAQPKETLIPDPVRDLREMDQLVYQMGQATDANTLRHLVARALELTNIRMRAESDRITELLEPELRKVYGEVKPAAKPPRIRLPKFLQKQIGPK